MEETVFFNLGNALASNKDEKELIRTVQIEEDRRKSLKGKLVIVHDEQNNEHLLFNLDDQVPQEEATFSYKIKDE